MRKFTILLVAFLMCTNLSYSKLPPHTAELQQSKKYLVINLPGEEVEDGFFTPSRTITIEKVPQNMYLKHVLHVKTKNHLLLRKDKTAELTPSILSSGADLSIFRVRALFAEYSEYSKLSEDKTGVGRIYEVSYKNPIDAFDAAAELMKNPDIEYAVPVFIHQQHFQPNDPQIGQQYFLSRIDATNAWDVTKGSKQIKIAIIDSGTDYAHEDLADNTASGGYDFVGDISEMEAAYGNWKPDNDPRPLYTTNTHGTHVAGCANAVTNNGKGIASIGMNCTFIPIKCGPDNGNIPGIYRGYEAILYAAQNGAQIINCSWGGPSYSPAGQDMINQAVALGATIVVSAGNEGSNNDNNPKYPASYDNVISVGATNSADKVASFSNFGYTTAIFAPGQDIYATMPGNKYSNNSGTSMSSPVAAGLAALVKTVFPNYTPKQIYHQLRSTCDNVLATGTQRPLYYGRVNAYRAVSFNNPTFPDRKTPGCDVTSFKIGTTDALVNNLQQEVRFTVSNFLSPTSSNFKINITPLDYFIKVTEKSLNVGEIATLGSKELALNVMLSQDNPWFSGFANILLTFEDGNYIDYKLFRIPIKVNSDNSHSVHSTFSDNDNILLHNVHARSKSLMWAVGNSNRYGYSISVLYRFTPQGKSYGFITNSPAYAVHAFDNVKGIVGTAPSNGNSQLLTTTNGGSNWNPINVSTVTSFVNDLHFFNASDGVMVGDPKNNVWGIAYSNNGGETWIHNTSVPAPIDGEEHYVGATSTYKDNLWFGTTRGRIFRTMNKGLSWTANYATAGNSIYNVAFAGKDTGMVIFGGSTTSSDRWVAFTTNGGSVWTNANFNFSAKNVMPTALYGPEGTGVFVALCRNGEVLASHDLGKNWRPVLSKYTPTAVAGAGVIDAGKIRLWMAGVNVASLDFNVPIANVKRLLNTQGVDKFVFDSVLVGSNKISNIAIANPGNTKTTIESITFTGENADDFRTAIGTSTFVEAEATGTVRIRFAPTAPGLRKANMIISSDAEQALIEIPVEGFGYVVDSKTLSTNGVSELNFDSVEVLSKLVKSFTLKNTGTSSISLSIALENGNSGYSIKNSSIPQSLGAGSEIDLEIEFNPKAVGEFSDNIIITNDGVPAEIKVALNGIGFDLSSVAENQMSIAGIYPNPTTSSAFCLFTSDNANYITAELVDISGRVMLNVFSGFAFEGENLLHIPCESLAKGTYFLRIETKDKQLMKKLLVE